MISIELLAYFSQLTIIASELSEEAIRVARKNLQAVLAPRNEKKERLKILHVKDPLEVLFTL